MERRPNNLTLFDAPHEASERGLIRSQMVIQIPWKEELGLGKIFTSIKVYSKTLLKAVPL
jgi:hypothetical protein